MERNLVILRSVYGKVGQKYFITPCRDPKTGRFPDCVRPVNSNGDMIMSDADRNDGLPLIPENRVIIVEDGAQFDLNDPWKKAEWEAIKNAPIIAPARDARDSKGNLLIDGAKAEGMVAQMRARYGVAELYIETPGAATAARVTRKRLIHDAETYIYNDNRGAEGRVLKARLLGKNMKNVPDSEVTDFLLKIAEQDPKKIINIYTGTDTALRLLLIDAKERKIIIVKNKVYMYNDEALGVTDDAVIAYFQNPKNAKMLELITRDTYPELEVKKTDKKKSEESK